MAHRSYLLVLIFSLLSISSCSSRGVMMVHPQTGATMKCGAAGVGIGTMAGFPESFVEDCLRRYEGWGFVLEENLTPEQRADLERRGLLPKPERPPSRFGY
ncbi:MAG: hypothetical protein ACREQA_02660 [Candidatus Binatia bacterium]